MLPRLVVIAWLAMLAGGAVAQNATLSVGLAEIEITPPLGYRMDGYFAERLSTGTKDPLKAKPLVFQQGTTKMALVVADLIGVSQELTPARCCRRAQGAQDRSDSRHPQRIETWTTV